MISIPTYRACALCIHGRTPQPNEAWTDPRAAADRVCVCPEVTGRRKADWPIAVAVDLARARTGPCGPEANHLSFAGLHP